MIERLAYVAAGAAGMYCGSCIHDNTLARALIRKGVDVALIPTYTPIRTDEEDVSEDRVFFGGLNVYLQHKSTLFRHTPWMLDRLLDRPAILNALGRFSGSTSAEDLGGLTVSMLEGKDGPHAKELDKLLDWLRSFDPDVVQLTNSMFLGFAGPIREALDVSVVVAFQGEDIFLDALVEPFQQQARALMASHGKSASAYTATSQYYAGHMAAYVGVDPVAIDVVPLGLDLTGHGAGERADDDTFRVGYLARVCPEKGLHILVEAFRRLVDANGDRNLALHVAGWVGKRDEDYLAGIREQVDAWGLSDRVDFRHDFDRAEKVRFLGTLDVLSVPTPYREPKGLFALEAMANGVPVVLPAHGSFPEYVERTGGGVLVPDATPEHVADGIQTLIDDPDLRRRLGEAGRRGVSDYYTDDRMADDTLAVYRRCIESHGNA